MKNLLYFLLLPLFCILMVSCEYFKPLTEKVTFPSAELITSNNGESFNVPAALLTKSVFVGMATAQSPLIYFKIDGQNDTIPLEVSTKTLNDLRKVKNAGNKIKIKIKKTSMCRGNQERRIRYDFVSVE